MPRSIWRSRSTAHRFGRTRSCGCLRPHASANAAHLEALTPRTLEAMKIPLITGDTRPAITDLDERHLAMWLADRGQPAYRARQIRRHIARGTGESWSALTDLPKMLRDDLARAFRWSAIEPVHEVESADGETRKVLLRLHDRHHIESVLMPHHGMRNSVCFSTQAGCPMACAFCATGEMGLIRQLSAGEIIDQIRHWQRELIARGERVSHVVAMGMGEPLANLEAVVAAGRRLSAPPRSPLPPPAPTHPSPGRVPRMGAPPPPQPPLN